MRHRSHRHPRAPAHGYRALAASIIPPPEEGDAMTIGAQLENIAVEAASRWEGLRDHPHEETARRTVTAIGRLAFTSSLVTTQILRRCLRLVNAPEALNVAVLQERLTARDVPGLLTILRANISHMLFLLTLAARSGGATFNAEELAVEYIAMADKDLNILHRLQKIARAELATR
jgi:hypothetical protein